MFRMPTGYVTASSQSPLFSKMASAGVAFPETGWFVRMMILLRGYTFRIK
jgi:hypothetical protein